MNDDMEQPEESSPGLMMPMAWVILAMLGSVAACAGVGISVADSESAGVVAAQVTAFPLGFLLCGAFAGLIVQFAVKRGTTLLRVLAPMGCGCLGGLIALGGTLVFFTTIFPAM